jgi:SAM-dependent methyltransferase
MTRLERVACDLCSSSDAEPFLEERDLLHGVEGRFNLVRCRECGLLYLNPRPTAEEMVRYYPESYAPYRSLVDHPSWKVRSEFLYGQWKNYRALKRYLPPDSGRILDVGCASGGFLAAMRRWGDWELYGVEIDARAAAHARDELGLDVFGGTLEEANFDDGFFHLITMWNVIEHLPHPQRALEEIARILRQGGVLAVSTPNPKCVERYLFGPYWAGWDAPRHLYIYSPEVLKRALNRAGFEVLGISSYSGGYSVLALTLENLLRDRLAKGRLRRILNAVIKSPIARAAGYPYYFLAGQLNISSVMTVFARRKERGRDS